MPARNRQNVCKVALVATPEMCVCVRVCEAILAAQSELRTRMRRATKALCNHVTCAVSMPRTMQRTHAALAFAEHLRPLSALPPLMQVTVVGVCVCRVAVLPMCGAPDGATDEGSDRNCSITILPKLSYLGLGSCLDSCLGSCLGSCLSFVFYVSLRLQVIGNIPNFLQCQNQEE
ncbi:KLTH0G07194p [Lachancea thermotolerans CBS 6340]|uniref:KLTH0G07194p n=1 Tax=Lachancea thermotolerans (strain ATCC 56472 / CBS 6340 / NRRL Y-8284) TaxID=559295 RepID=C5DMA3_LACTC|nr:KLTH0G07194p [Lachancea thermotolerans CBS 6340]CAR24914.1 KLTH0G07194p [Lachancea thermotolerans CBS 6340]